MSQESNAINTFKRTLSILLISQLVFRVFAATVREIGICVR